MKDEQDFHIRDPHYSVYRLKLEHSQALQRLFEQCADFNMIVHGEDVSPTAAQDIFQEVPPGRSTDDKFLFGIMHRKGELIGMVEGMIDYPDDRDWWIGLMLLAPGWRGQGLGRMIVEGFSEYVRSNQGKSIMLGVVDENQRDYSFWQQAGFKFVRETEPRKFGRKIHTVYVMRRVINLETTPE